MYICELTNINICNYQNQIANCESKFKIINKCDILKLKKFSKKLFEYKLSVNLLFANKDFYEELKSIEVSTESEKTIWDSEHYDFIIELRSIEPTIKLMLKDSVKLGFITKIQYELAKKISLKISNIFTTDTIFNSIYENENSKYNLPDANSIEFYFNIIEIIIYKMFEYSLEKNDYDISSPVIENLLLNSNYMNSIVNIKNILKNNLSS